jgi:hypothetical protein
LLDDCVSILGAGLEIHGDRRAGLGERQSDRPADAARGAGDERDASSKINQIYPPLKMSRRLKTCVGQQFV